MNKTNIRIKIKAHKSLLSEQERQDAADRAFARLEQSGAFVLAEHILLYHSLPDELPTHRFLEKWGSRKSFYLPRVNGVNLDLLPYNKSKLHMGAFNIEEPLGDDITPLDKIELIIVPAVAYDSSGNRIGRGKGYYDRMLVETKATKIGIAYDFQLIDDIEPSPHDIPVDIIITDKRYIKTRQ